MFIKILFGILGGILGGMGMGGGTLLIPLMTIFLGLSQNHAQSLNLIAFLPMAIVTLIIHSKNKLVDFKNSYLIIIFGVISAIGGSLLSSIIKGEILKKIFGWFLILVAVYQIYVFIAQIIKDKKLKKSKNNA